MALVATFLGGAQTVTGSRFLVETESARVLIDCGLFQGLKELRLRNWRPFPVEPSSIDAVIATHAHLDHIGYLPALVRAGFRGPIFATKGTEALAGIVLPDSGRLHEEEAEYANRKGYSKHRPALPLYTEADAYRTVERFEAQPFDEAFDVARGVTATLRAAGHILGSATVTLEAGGTTLISSGDLGRPEHPLLLPPEAPAAADAVLVESTYGDRRHDDGAGIERLRDAIVRTVERRGVVVIPAFAVDRTEVILYRLRELIESRKIPNLPVYVDSPMALAALEVYRRAIDERWPELHRDLGHESLFDPGHVIEVRTVEESKEINRIKSGAIIVAASGMATGGRVLHHLLHRLPDKRNTVVLAGFQATGTRGHLLLNHARWVKMLGRHVPVRAEIVDVEAFSVHADADEVMGWLKSSPSEPRVTYVVHGETRSSEHLRGRIEDELGWLAVVPRPEERVLIG